MSDSRPAVPADMAGHRPSDTPGDRGRSRDNAAFRIYALVLLVVGGAAAGVLWWRLPLSVHPPLVWVVPTLALGFLLAERLAINIDVRGGVSWTVSFTEIPMVIGLLTAPFQVVLLAHVLAGVGTLLVRRVADRALYNGAVMIIEVVSAFTVARGVSALVGGGPDWAGAFVGALAVPVTSTLFAVYAVRLLGRRMRLSGALKLTGRVLVVGLLNASFGVAGYEVVTHSPWGVPLVALVFAGLAAFYRAYSGLLREQRDLEALCDVSLLVARPAQQIDQPAIDAAAVPAVTDSDEWQAIAERIRDQVGVRRVVLRLWPDPRRPTCTVVAGQPLPAVAPDADRSPADDPLLRSAGSGVRRFRAAEVTGDLLDGLTARGAAEALVVPLRGSHQTLGVLEAHDRLSRWRGFGRADLQMIGTVASHLATAVDNRRLMARLRHDAYHDPLTGLLNRPGFRETAVRLLAHDTGSALLRIDLDLLSNVSDALGYAWGDRLVAAAGRRLREALGPDVPLARLEGGSFATVLVAHGVEAAQRVAERLRAELSVPYPVERLTVEAGAVIGYVTTEPGREQGEPEVDGLLRQADVAARAARGDGEPVRRYLPAMGERFLRRFQLVTQFRRALETGQIHVHYQPKIALSSRQVLGVEALVRWRHPEYGRLDPDEFVPAVEATGLVDALTAFVTDQALGRVRGWLDRGIRMGAAVNLSVRNLDHEDFPDLVADALARHGVPPDLLTFELTESGVMSDPQRALPVLRRLHALGVTLAVDDFGTGYSSLAYLRQLPVDEVKIDKSFVLGMGSDLGDLAVVRSIVELGHSLGLVVVAEGVEEDAVRDQLVGMGCDVAQGYLISRPLADDRLEAWLRARTVSAVGLRDQTVLTLVH